MGKGLHFRMVSEAQRRDYRAVLSPIMADIEQKPHRNYLANCTRPYTHLPIDGSLEARPFRRPNTTI